MSLAGAVQFLCRTVLIGPVLRVVGRPEIVGREHVPRRGAVILAANHLAAIDSLHLALAARRCVHFLAKDEYFESRGARGRMVRWFMAATGQIPVDRAGGDSARQAVRAAVEILRRDGVWGIHPEGTRSPDGAMYRGRTGTVRVALATGAPLIPVAITGTAPSRGLRGRERVRVEFLPPLDLRDVDADAVGIRAATDALMDAIAARTGQRRVDDYARRWRRSDESAA